MKRTKVTESMILILTALTLTACKESQSKSSAAGAAPPSPSPTVETRTLIVHHGSDWSCIVLSAEGRIYCKGNEPRMGLNSVTYSLRFASASPITGFESRDESFCFEAAVDTRPVSRTPGTATYCIGEASLESYVVAIFPVAYSPPFDPVTNATPDLTWATEPFAGADMSLHEFLTQTVTADPILTDGVAAVGSEDVECEVSDSNLVCPDFILTGAL